MMLKCVNLTVTFTKLVMVCDLPAERNKTLLSRHNHP
jgi:hypothetical protein